LKPKQANPVAFHNKNSNQAISHDHKMKAIVVVTYPGTRSIRNITPTQPHPTIKT
jgi:hypothetical protein